MMRLCVLEALLLRFFFVYRRSPVRLLDVFFWPTMELLVWGFVTRYLQGLMGGSGGRVFLALLGALILWDLLYRVQQGVAVSFLEDVWAKNLVNIFAAPVSLGEYVASTFLFGSIRALCSSAFLVAVASWAFDLDLLSMGLPLLLLVLNLFAFGLSLGVVSIALVLRFGHSAELLAWAIPALLQPLAAVFYPLEVMPYPLALGARLLPLSYVFEGMRSLFAEGSFDPALVLLSSGLNAFFLVLSFLSLDRSFQAARARGSIPKLNAD